MAVQTEAREVGLYSGVKDEEDSAADDEVDWPGEDSDGVVSVSGRTGVRLDRLEEAVVTGGLDTAEED